MLLDAVEVGFCVVIVGVGTTIGILGVVVVGFGLGFTEVVGVVSILGVVVVGFELEIDCGVVIPLSKEELSDL